VARLLILLCAFALAAAQPALGADPTLPDTDGDGVADSVDNCPDVANHSQRDRDGDGVGDACDADRDGDQVANAADNCPDTANADQRDGDADGLGDLCDVDRDGDGVSNRRDNCPDLANPDQRDSDGDRRGDPCDPTPLPVAPASRPAPPAPKRTAPAKRAPDPPKLSQVALTRRSVVLCGRRARGRRCRPKPLAVMYHLDRDADVHAELSRRRCRAKVCEWKSVGSRTIVAIRGQSAFTIGARFGRYRISPGRYRLVLSAHDETGTSTLAQARFLAR
jgi:hypothetical protein